MQQIQGRNLTSLVNVKSFVTDNAAVLDGVITPALGARLDGSISELSAHAAAQDGHSRIAKGATEQTVRLRRALLRDHMAPIAHIAAMELPSVAGVIALKLPGNKINGERLVAAAEGMAQAAVPYADAFIVAGCKTDFVEALKGKAGDLRAALDDRKQSLGRKREATTELRVKLARGRKIVNAIDALMKSALSDKPGLLERWITVKRVARPRAAAGSVARRTLAISNGVANGGITAAQDAPVTRSAAAA